MAEQTNSIKTRQELIGMFATSAELKAYIKDNLPKDDIEAENRRNALCYKQLNEATGFTTMNVHQMDGCMPPKGKRSQHIWDEERYKKLVVERAIKKVADFDERHKAWVEMGKPPNWLEEINNIAGFNLKEE